MKWGLSVGMPQIVGSPEQVADQIESIWRETGCHGFNVTPNIMPVSIDDFVNHEMSRQRIPGLELDERDYFRDVYDHLIRISDLIDSYRDLLSGATDLYLSTVSNRQNDVMKQLTIIATIFLPLSFITGFFGENFGYLVRNIGTFWWFWGLGVGSMTATVVGLVIFFRRKGWV